ncbi:hypothetical protein GCM10023085_33260 [Actinomadura viridis]
MLDLPAHRQLGLVQVDVIPAQPEHLPTPQAQDENEHERRLERIPPLAGQLAGLVDRPGLDLAAPRLGHAQEPGHDDAAYESGSIQYVQ